jgi:ketosteroid isomerase-like protein
LRQRLQNQRLTRAIKDFHDSIHKEEIERQLDGTRPSDFLLPPTVRYQRSGRARVAKLFSQLIEVSDKEEIFHIRMKLIREISLLYKQLHSIADGTYPGSQHHAPNLQSANSTTDLALNLAGCRPHIKLWCIKRMVHGSGVSPEVA